MRISDPEYNRLRILKAIRRAEPVSRTELAQLTGLAGGTITEVTGELVRRNVLLEEKLAAGGLGRPRIGLRLNPAAAHVVCVYLADGLTVDVADARGEVICRQTRPYQLVATFEAFADLLAEAIDAAVTASGVPRASIQRIGVALPAIVDRDAGVLHMMRTLPPGPSPIAELLQARLSLPVVVDNTINVLARAEHWFGEDRQLDDFTLLTYDGWLGLAQYVDGQLWSGGLGINAEISHSKLDTGDQRRCWCGGLDCLGIHTSIIGLVGAVSAARGEPRPPLDQVAEKFRCFAAEAREGEVVAARAFERAGRLLGRAVGGYINTFNPARVLILTTTPEALELIEPPFRVGLQEAALPLLHARVPVQWKLREAFSYAEGAAALVLEELYRVPGANASRKTAAMAASRG